MKKNLGQLLVDKGLITEKILSEALQRQVIFGGRLGTNLLEMGAISEDALMKLLALQYNVPYAESRHFKDIPKEVLDSVPRELLNKHRIIPIAMDGNNITLAMRDPQMLDIVDEVAFQTDKIIRPVIASELRIVQALEYYYDIRREARYIAAPRGIFTEQERQADSPGQEPVEEPREEVLEGLDIIELTEDDVAPGDPFDVSEINEAFANVRYRDEVAQTVIRSCLRIMDDVFMFIIKGDEAQGWMSGGTAKPVVDFGVMSLPVNLGNALERVRETRTLQRFNGVDTFESNPWLKELSIKVPKEVIICPLVLKKHIVSAIVGFSFKEQITDDEAAFIVRIMRKASVAFEILIMKSRIIML
jgi:hypothetical protein